jgi:uncharacterized tellurite resistance protein B-like protein
MPNWQEIKERVAARGRVDDYEVENLRRLLYTDGKINRQEADALADLHKLVKHRTPAFEQFFTQVVRDYVLEDGRISAYKAAWLRQMLFADGTIDDEDRMLLRQLKWDAREVSPEFDALLKEVMKQPPRHTSVK